MAMESITATTGAVIVGQLLARTGAVTLDSNIITNNVCTALPTDTETGTATSTATGSASPSVTPVDLPPTSTPWTNLMGLGGLLTFAAVLGIVLLRRIQG
jgi:type VI secretion system secreted protein VgrG